jgi:ferredoxin
MMTYVVGALAMAALCSGWVLVQRWIAHSDPDVRGPEDGCHGCGGCGDSCERKSQPPAPMPSARALPDPRPRD